MKIVVGCDEAAYRLKEEVKLFLQKQEYEVIDVGVYNEDASLYPDTAKSLCMEIISKHADKGILMCGTGIGMAITANKIPGIRAAIGHDLLSVERSIKSNNCQVLCMGARIVAPEYAKLLLEHWLNCEFAGGASEEKVARIMEIEQEYRR